jgi:DNA modification methylase
LKMAKELGRHWIGIEISQEYCDLCKKRVEAARVPLFT